MNKNSQQSYAPPRNSPCFLPPVSPMHFYPSKRANTLASCASFAFFASLPVHCKSKNTLDSQEEGHIDIFWMTFSGTSANAGPHYQKLYARVTHIWGNRRGQPNRSAMRGPRPGRTSLLIKVNLPRQVSMNLIVAGFCGLLLGLVTMLVGW